MLKRLLAAAAALTLAAPIAAQAQEVPSYAQVASTDQQIQGRITGFDGGYNLTVRDGNGYVDNVELHDGTIINPTGITLAPGMIVSILGSNSGSYFAADEVDTPYTIDSGIAYYGGHPWDYYGPTISLGFFFGNSGWWHPGYARGYAYSPPVHVTNVVNVHEGGSPNRGGFNGFAGNNANFGHSGGTFNGGYAAHGAPPAARPAPVHSAPVGGHVAGGRERR
jgi:hypothetical protein